MCRLLTPVLPQLGLPCMLERGRQGASAGRADDLEGEGDLSIQGRSNWTARGREEKALGLGSEAFSQT